MKMVQSKSSTTSTILLPECQADPRARRRQSFMAHPLESLKSTVSSIGKKLEEHTRKVETEDQERDEDEKESSRASFEVALPQPRPQSQVRFQESNARQFPEDWQTSLYPQGSTLRQQNRSTRRNTRHGSSFSGKRIWPSLGARCKFFRLVVVASPSLQRLASQEP